MAILTHSGRAALAASVKNETLHLAIGRGRAFWDTTQTVTASFAPDDRLELGFAHLSDVVVKSQDGATTYTSGTDYTVNATTGVLTRIHDGSIPAESTVSVTMTVNRPPEDVEATALIDEIARRAVDEVYFVEPDPDGEISLSTGRYRTSTTPTPHLFIRTKFDFTDAVGATIREQAVFVGTQTDQNLPAGQRYFTPDQLTDPGVLLLIENTPPIVRQASTRETFEFVLTF